MNTLISFEIAKLLKEKGFVFRQYETYHNPVNGFTKYEEITPTISEVVMWLYEKHNIWIYSFRHDFDKEFYWSIDTKNEDEFTSDDVFNSPTEAYEAAIEYTLNNLL